MSRVRAVALAGVVLAFFAGGCGGSHESTIGVAKPAPYASNEWPARTTWPIDAATVEDVSHAADGASVQLIAYLAAVKLPCPACNVGGPKTREEATGRTARPGGPTPPGCVPCPDPAATLSDASPRSPDAQGTRRPRLRAVGLAGALQERHVGHSFFFTGVLRANGVNGPELDVTDVRSLDGP